MHRIPRERLFMSFFNGLAYIVLAVGLQAADGDKAAKKPSPAAPDKPEPVIELTDDLSLPTVPYFKRLLEEGKGELKGEDWLKGTRWLQSLILDKADVFLMLPIKGENDQENTRPVSAHAAARRMLQSMPEKGRAFYLRF